MTSKPEDIAGHVILVAHLTAAPGKGEEAQAVIRKVMESANSAAEPGTLVYRVSRFNEEFVHFEE
ncbi:hypothetical protein DL93DRAFT_2173244 [Clavulina sp. PMI_390]|nr:hypothetical protein DL93DRAFT_2173244 [Clavulina sp. PMI_390]